MADLLDPWLYRHPFEGRSARRYAARERIGFGDLDERLIAAWAPELAGARRFLDVGAGPQAFAAKLTRAHPHLAICCAEPSRDFATASPWPVVRAAGEHLPFRDGAFDLGLCLSSIRHVADRLATLRELRRVVSGTAWLVELDPDGRDRAHNHTQAMPSLALRLAFAPLVLATAPRAEEIAAVAERAGWRIAGLTTDPVQPVYVIRIE